MLNVRKCVFLKKQVVYFGLRVDVYAWVASGLLYKDASVPKDVSELRAFLGMVQYYSHFLPGLTVSHHSCTIASVTN